MVRIGAVAKPTPLWAALLLLACLWGVLANLGRWGEDLQRWARKQTPPPPSSQLFGRSPEAVVAALNAAWSSDPGAGTLALRDDYGPPRACDADHAVCVNIDAPDGHVTSVMLVAKHQPGLSLSHYGGDLLGHLLELAAPGVPLQTSAVVDLAVNVGDGGTPARIQLPNACAGAADLAGAIDVRLDPGACPT